VSVRVAGWTLACQRISSASADVGTLAPALLGASHLLFADRAGAAPEPEAVRKVVTTVIADVVQQPLP